MWDEKEIKIRVLRTTKVTISIFLKNHTDRHLVHFRQVVSLSLSFHVYFGVEQKLLFNDARPCKHELVVRDATPATNTPGRPRVPVSNYPPSLFQFFFLITIPFFLRSPSLLHSRTRFRHFRNPLRMSSFPAPELPAGRPIKRGSIAQRPNSMFATPASTSPKVMRRNPTTPDVPLPDALTSRQPSVTSLPVDPLKSEHIQVAVRLRPLSEAELNSNQASIWDVEQETGCVHMQTMWQERLKKTTGVTDFQFGAFYFIRISISFHIWVEHVYLGSDTERIYANGLHQLVWSSMEGYNG